MEQNLLTFKDQLKDCSVVVSCYLRFFSSLTRSVSLGSLHSEILNLKPLIDMSDSEGCDIEGGKKGRDYYKGC